MYEKFFAALLSATFASCGTQDLDGKHALLIGGTPSRLETDFPATVGLSLKGTLWTGTKIAPHVVLTAAHCVTDSQGSLRIADGGDFGMFTYSFVAVPPNRTHEKRRIRTLSTLVHPAFRAPQPGPDDIAIIVTEDPVDWIPEAALDFNPVNPEESVFVAGYGCEEGRNVPP